MRKFLPIRGPGGRYLTAKEKVALLVLAITLALCVLTVLAGENAYGDKVARNPVFSVVAFLCQTLGGGIVALYGLVLIWSGLIYFKGEKVADVSPFSGRLFAALAVTVGVSGALGIAHLQTAGELGAVVGHALGRTFGAGLGFPILLLLMLLGVHLAGQGTWNALREPIPVGAAVAPRASVGFSVDELPERRFTGEPMQPDDGDPTADERTLAVTQAMEEIERSQGVTIVDVEPDPVMRPSIGEDVEAAPPPPADSDEAEVRRGLLEISQALGAPSPAAVDEEDYAAGEHGFVPVPAEETGIAPEEEAESDYAEEEEDQAEAGADEEYEDEASEDAAEHEEDEGATDEYEAAEEEAAEADDEDEPAGECEEAEADEDAEEYEEDEGVTDECEEEEPEVAEGEAGLEEDEELEGDEEQAGEESEPAMAEAAVAEAAEPEEEAAVAEAAEPEEEAQEQADGFVEESDPYARGGLLRRMQQTRPDGEPQEGDRRYTTFDWRGRPVR